MATMPHALEAAGCRVCQGALKLGNCLLPYRTPKALTGPGALARLPAQLRAQGIQNVLLVTGASLLGRGIAAPLLEAMDREGISCTVLSLSAPDPTSEDVERGYRLYREKGCHAIAALGGGSRMDCAKAIAARAAQPRKSVARLQGLLTVHRPVPPLFAIPTTAGSGSETTMAAVITDSATHRKAAINDPVLIPQWVVLDPTLTLSLPPFTTATTGMDALTHAVEAYTNHTYNTALENRLARQATALIHQNLPAAYADGSDRNARQNMQTAAFYAGRAFTRGGVGYVHAVGHTLGGLYNIPHGLAMAVLLPHVLRQYGPAVHRRLAELAQACGMEGATEAAQAERFLIWIEETNQKMGLPDHFTEIQEADYPQIIAWARREAHPLYPVPVIWRDADFRRLLDRVRR